MVHGDKSPISHHARNPDVAVLVLAGDEVLDRRCVEQLHVRELEHLGQQGAGE